MVPNFKDILGKTFGCWEVIAREGSDSQGHALWRCRCTNDGCEIVVRTYALEHGKIPKTSQSNATVKESTTIQELINKADYSEYGDAFTYAELEMDIKDLLTADILDTDVYFGHCINAGGSFKPCSLADYFDDYVFNNTGYRISDRAYSFDAGTVEYTESIVNFITGHSRFDKATLSILEDCFIDYLMKAQNGETLIIPKLGCGKNGLDWNDVRNMIIENLYERENDPINVIVCI